MDLAGRVFSQQLDRDKPLWEIWLVEGLEDDRFALLAKTHHALVDGVSGIDIVSVLFDTSPEPAAPDGARPAVASAAAAQRRPDARRGAPRARHRSRRARAHRARRVPRAAPSARGLKNAAVGVGAMAWAGLNPAPPSPYNARDRPAPPLHLGARRAARHQGDQGLARRHRQRRGAGHRRRRARAPPAPPRAADRRARAQGDDSRERALRDGARRARQPGGGDDGAAPGVVPGAAGPARHRAPGAERPQAGRPGRGRPGAHRPERLRAADDHGPGGAPDVPPALLQPGRDERARDRSSRSTWRAGACSTRSRWCRWPRARAWAWRSSPTTAGSTSGWWATSTCSGTSTSSRTTCARRLRSWRTWPA